MAAAPPSRNRTGFPAALAFGAASRLPSAQGREAKRMIVAIANQKGGVGKTTTAINLAAALAMRGKPTLLIDLDPQANTTMSYLDATGVSQSVYDAITDDKIGFGDIVQQSTHENLWIAPSRIALAKLESKLVGEIDAHFRLKDRLAPIRQRFPYIVIDCPPALGLLTVNALVAATHLLIPIQSSYFALEGTDDLLETVEKVRARANPGLRILGVVITMHDKRTSLARDIRAQIDKVFGTKVFKTVITKSVRLEESPAYKESIFSFAPESSGATEYYRLCEEVMDRA
jgi:chromosome partitioning protein